MPKRKAAGPSARARRAIAAAAPQLIEGDRSLLGLRGPAASAVAIAAMRYLVSLKRTDGRMLVRKNDIRPFEDASSLEFLLERNRCSSFVMASHKMTAGGLRPTQSYQATTRQNIPLLERHLK